MTRKKTMHGAGESLQTAMQRAWDSFDDPENQKRVAARAAEESERSKTNEYKARLKKLRRWGVPKKVAKPIASDSVNETFAVRSVRGSEERPQNLLMVLAGNPGSGKTTAACTRIEERGTGFLVRAAELVEMGTHFSDRDLLSKYRRCGVLVIDDLGLEYRDEHMLCRLDGLIDSRTSDGLPTIITTNMAGPVFERRYEARIWSRIHQFGDYIELDDPDLRVTPIGSGKKP